MEAKARQIVILRLDDGRGPFDDWLGEIKDF